MQFEEKSLRKFNVGANMVPKDVRLGRGLIWKGGVPMEQDPTQLNFQLVKEKDLRNFLFLKTRRNESYWKHDSKRWGFIPSKWPNLVVSSRRFWLRVPSDMQEKELRAFFHVWGGLRSQGFVQQVEPAGRLWEVKSPERPLCEVKKWNLGCIGDPKLLEKPEPQNICQGELNIWSRTCPRKRRERKSRQQSWQGRAI